MPAGLLLLLGLAIALTDAACIGKPADKATDLCDSEIYCRGDLLKTVQLASIFNDSKTFVDLSQLNDPSVTISNFNKLMKETNNKPNRTQVQRYVSENFNVSNELEDWMPPDWQKRPGLLHRIKDPKYRNWAEHLNNVWKTLGRKITKEVQRNPEKHSLIYVENGFVVPGGRFNEFYYWDSYWVIKGLLLCGMHQTVKGMILNFLSMVVRYGFIPNGGRVYYLMRSQPPMLIPMVDLYLEATNDVDFLKEYISILEKEFNYWQREKTVKVNVNGKSNTLARYYVQSPSPRPESYREDYELAQKLPVEKQGEFYNNIKAGAESGWDFTSRWFIRESDVGTTGLQNISASNIIPVDLNAILQQNARLLSSYHYALGNLAKAQHYAKIAESWQEAIDNVLWNEESGIWFDYDIKNNKVRKSFYPSNLVPLYTRSYDKKNGAKYAQRAVAYLHREKIDSFFGGTPTSLNLTGEQWDFPNAWPPLQSFIINGLYLTGVEEAVNEAITLADRWVRSNYLGYVDYGAMFEKYDAVLPGKGGGGGEYNVQVGFGWTNGVILELLNTFPFLKPNVQE